MAQLDDRMELIGSAIIDQAKKEARELIDKANEIRDKEITAFEDEVVDSMFDKVQAGSSNLRLGSIKAIATKQLESHKALLLHRSKKTEEVIESVSKRLIDYTETQQYKDDILKRADKIKESCDHNGSVIMVLEKDIPLAGEISKILGGGKVQADPGIRLGGFRLRNEKEHILIDETLDERLEEQKPWLLENCGLKVQ